VAVSVSVVFPMYNEEGYIRRAVRAAEAALGELGDDWQIVIVDDASTDATAAIAAELARAEPRLELLRNERRRGLSTLSSPRVILGILSEMLAQWPELARGRRASRAAGTPVRQDR
jgi:cellulose synthase/poly-beta-1,6-N-acetylglucosamine synthase-like glycosyltransferase